MLPFAAGRTLSVHEGGVGGDGGEGALRGALLGPLRRAAALLATSGGIDAAVDVVAETFLIAWRRLPEVPAEHARAWLYMTARHVIANELRARQRRDRLSGHTRDDIATDRAAAGDHATVIAEQIRVRSVFTIHPDAIPSGDQLLVLPRWLRTEGAPTEALELRSLIVRALPQCVPNPGTSIMTTNAIEPR